jgi:hypothetical protein
MIYFWHFWKFWQFEKKNFDSLDTGGQRLNPAFVSDIEKKYFQEQ